MPYNKTTNCRAFNSAFNKFAGTTEVEYAQEFPMDVHTGAQYLARNRASIGRQYATQVLENKVSDNNALQGESEHHDMTLRQRAVLSFMRSTTSDQQFDSALHAAMEFGALSSSARHVFAEGYALPPMLNNGHAHASSDTGVALPAVPAVPEQLVQSVEPDVVALVPEAVIDKDHDTVMTPNRVMVNLASSVGRSVPLGQKAKRARKK